MKTLQTLSLGELKQELIRLYDGNAGEIYYGLLEMGITQKALKKCLISYIEKKQLPKSII